ncbi:MAG: ABC transporter substrate-binding protein [Spirochaetales bacterium]|uniref:ABC transporter substrate-binding protein n=1 Tax=Treponema TaxID=157 RepID=UPI00258700CD|nr:ABC transporter substrate-binding protein [uncultured Treponema sp.]MDO5766544.1 ABC transporter substrate-binding protein [Spirochaetales bacterium]
MKKILGLLCISAMAFSFMSCGDKKNAKNAGELVVYGSCEEEYLAAACAKFESLTGVRTTFQRLSTGEVLTKIEEEKGNPSADVWFGGTTDPYNEAAAKGLLLPVEPKNASHLVGKQFKDANNNWFGIYRGILGFFWNTEELQRLKLEPPKDWDDLLKPEYKGLVSFANPNTAGTGKLIVNTMVQLKGEKAAMDYFAKLDKNICQYTKSGSGPSKLVPTGEIVIGIGFLHDVVYQIVNNGYTNIGMTSPSSGTSYEIGATAIFKGAKNLDNAKKFIEFALSPDCVNLAQDNGSYQFLVIDNAKPVEVAIKNGLDKIETMVYNFDDAKTNGPKYYAEFFEVISKDDRVKTK